MVVPPVNLRGEPIPSQSLSTWQVVERFSGQVDCNAELQRLQFVVHGWYGPIGAGQNTYQIQAAQILQGQCVFKDATKPHADGS